MNLEQMREKLRDMKAEMSKLSARAAQTSVDPNATEKELDEAHKAANLARKRYSMLQEEIADMEKEQQAPGATRKHAETAQEKGLKALLKSNEYLNSFFFALRTGAKPGGAYSEQLKPVYDALTIAGGTPAGSDGGFLVPEDFDMAIRERMRDYEDLATLLTEEPVTSNVGWRNHDEAPTKGFTKLTGEMKPVPKDDQPVFGRVDFKLDTYGLIVPVSNELMQDEAGVLMPYLAKWFAKKLVITRNKLFLELLSGLSASALTEGKLNKGVISLLNKGLDPAISRNAVIVTNQDGFDALEQEEDANKRPLLVPDVTDGSQYRIRNRKVKMVSNALLPNAEGSAPLYVGDFKEFGTLFNRMPMEVKATDIGGDAWASNGWEVRGIVRMGARVFDNEAAVARTIAAGT